MKLHNFLIEEFEKNLKQAKYNEKAYASCEGEIIKVHHDYEKICRYLTLCGISKNAKENDYNKIIKHVKVFGFKGLMFSDDMLKNYKFISSLFDVYCEKINFKTYEKVKNAADSYCRTNMKKLWENCGAPKEIHNYIAVKTILIEKFLRENISPAMLLKAPMIADILASEHPDVNMVDVLYNVYVPRYHKEIYKFVPLSKTGNNSAVYEKAVGWLGTNKYLNYVENYGYDVLKKLPRNIEKLPEICCELIKRKPEDSAEILKAISPKIVDDNMLLEFYKANKKQVNENMLKEIFDVKYDSVMDIVKDFSNTYVKINFYETNSPLYFNFQKETIEKIYKKLDDLKKGNSPETINKK